MRLRKQLITNLYVTSKDITRLANGYVIYKRANNHTHSIIPKSKVFNDRIRNKKHALEDKIAKLKSKLSTLLHNDTISLSTLITPNRTSKRKYTLHNAEYWSKKSTYMKEHSPLIKYHAKKK